MNIGRWIAQAAERYPDRPAFIWGERRVSYREASARVRALAAALRSVGLRRGDRAAVYMWNGPQLLETAFAIWQVGATLVPLNARFLADEVVYHVEDPQAKVVVCGEEFRDTIAGIRDRLPSVEAYICLANPAEGQFDYETLIREHAGAPLQIEEVAEHDLAWLFYTSGTTGRPKGAMLTHGGLSCVTIGWCADLMYLEPEDVGLHAAPLTHGAGFHALALTAKAAAHVLPVSPRFDPRTFCELVQRHGITNTWLVPTQIKLLLTFPELDRYDLSSLRYVVYGGAPMYVEDLKEALRRIGPIFVQIFAQGETPMTGTYLRREDHVVEGSDEVVGRLASCGYARTGMEVAVLDDEDREVPRGEIGEICIHGPAVMAGYWERPKETAEALRNGWLHTGDLGYLDRHGFLYIMDRKKDMIISGGANVYPREVEEVLLQHPAVLEACVVGVPDDLWGEAVKAVVSLRSGVGATESDLIDFCGRHLAGYKKPKSVDFVAELPKSAYGKTLKREVRAHYWQGQARLVR